MAITAGTWQPISEIGLVQPISSTSTTQYYKIGHTVRCRDMGSTDYGEADFVYWGGLDDTVAGDLVVFDGAITKRAVARDEGACGVAMSACPTSSYGWYQVTGKAIITAGDVADNAQLYLTATAGSVDDAHVLGDHILGARSAGATDTAQVLAIINHPKVADTDNSA